MRRRTSDYTRRYRLAQGETLSQVAATYYRDPTLWRPIAIANGIDDPRRLDVAVELTVPKLPYRDPDSGLLYTAA